jgi:multidrug efflux pump subunit AcrB
VQIFGKVERELTIELDPQRLQASNVSVGQVVQACRCRTSPRRSAGSRARWTSARSD